MLLLTLEKIVEAEMKFTLPKYRFPVSVKEKISGAFKLRIRREITGSYGQVHGLPNYSMLAPATTQE